MKETTDVWFAAYLVSQGHPIISYDVIHRGKVKCKFQVTEEQWRGYKTEFMQSELSKFKGIIEQIKDLGY